MKSNRGLISHYSARAYNDSELSNGTGYLLKNNSADDVKPTSLGSPAGGIHEDNDNTHQFK
jgi:hypothetical protein